MHFVHFEMEICLKTGKILFTFPKEGGFAMVWIISPCHQLRHTLARSLTRSLADWRRHRRSRSDFIDAVHVLVIQ